MNGVVHLIEAYSYWILIPLSFIEGPIVAFVAGTLASLGYLNIYVLVVFFLARDLGVDFLCYYIGYFGGRQPWAKRLLGKIGVGEEDLDSVRHLWQRHPAKTMFFSKLSYGLSAGFIVVAGMVDMPIVRFFQYGLLVTVLQYGVLLFLGYFFGNSFGTISVVLENLQYVIGGLAVLFIVYYFFKRYISRRLKEQEKEAKD